MLEQRSICTSSHMFNSHVLSTLAHDSLLHPVILKILCLILECAFLSSEVWHLHKVVPIPIGRCAILISSILKYGLQVFFMSKMGRSNNVYCQFEFKQEKHVQ